MKKSFLIFIFSSILIICLGAAGFYFYKQKKRTPLTPQNYFEIYQTLMEKQNFPSAYAHLKKASELLPNNKTYAWELAKIEFSLKNYKRSHSLALNVWNQGQKDLETLKIMVYSMQGDNKRNLKSALAFLEELPESEELEFFRGEIFLRFQEIEQSKQVFLNLYQSKPASNIAFQLARIYLQTKEPKKALDLLENHQKQNSLDKPTLLLLSKIYESFNQRDKVYETFDKLNNDFIATPGTEFEKASMMFLLGDYQTSANVLQNLVDSSLLNLSDITQMEKLINEIVHSTDSGYVNLRKEFDSKDLEQFKSYSKSDISTKLHAADIIVNQFNKILDKDPSSLVNWSDEASHLQENSKSNPKAQNRFHLSSLFPKYLRSNSFNFVAHQSRLLLSLIYLTQNDFDKIPALADYASGDHSLLEGERYFYAILENLPDLEKDQTEELNIARSLLKNNPIVEFVTAMYHSKQGKPDKAISSFESLAKNSPEFSRNAIFSLEYANALAQNQKIDQALSVISQLHARKIFSQASLQLFRNLTFSKGLHDLSWETQKLLQESFQNNDALKLQGSLMALEMGKEELAMKSLEELSQKYPDNQQIKITKILSLIKQKQFNDALSSIENEDLPVQVKNQLQGSIFAAQKKFDQAIPLFEQIVQDENYLVSAIDLCKLYLANQQLDKATDTIKEAISKGLETQQAFTQLIRCYLLQKKYEDALTTINASKKTSSDSWEITLLEGWALYYLQMYKEASKTIAQLSTPENGEKSKLLLQGLVTYAMGDLDQAQRHLESYLKNHKDKTQDYFLASWNISNIYFRKAQYPKAIAHLETILSNYPKENPAISLKFKSLLFANQEKEALNFLSKTKDQRDKLLFSLDQAFYFEQKKEYSKALQALEKYKTELPALYEWTRIGLKSNQNFKIPGELLSRNLTGRDWGKLGIIASSLGNWEAADQSLAKAYEKNPSNPIILNNWAWTLLELNSNDKEKIIQLCEEANRLLPNNADILDTYINALARFKNHDKIITLSQNHLVLFAENPKSIYLIGHAHESRNKFKDAIRYYETAMSLQNEHWALSLTKPELEEKVKSLKELSSQK